MMRFFCEVEVMGRDMGALVRAVVKDMQWNRSVEKIAKRQDVSVEIVEQILQIYTTHPGITTDGILNRLPDWLMEERTDEAM